MNGIQKSVLASMIDRELKPARLDVAMPWELPQSYKDAIGEAMAGEAWLQRMGLEGLLTGLTNADMRVFRDSVARLVGMLRYARETGVKEGSDAAVSAALLTSRRRIGYAALAALGVGVLFGALLF